MEHIFPSRCRPLQIWIIMSVRRCWVAQGYFFVNTTCPTFRDDARLQVNQDRNNYCYTASSYHGLNYVRDMRFLNTGAMLTQDFMHSSPASTHAVAHQACVVLWMQGARIAVAVVLIALAFFTFFLVFWLIRRRRRNNFQVGALHCCTLPGAHHDTLLVLLHRSQPTIWMMTLRLLARDRRLLECSRTPRSRGTASKTMGSSHTGSTRMASSLTISSRMGSTQTSMECQPRKGTSHRRDTLSQGSLCQIPVLPATGPLYEAQGHIRYTP